MVRALSLKLLRVAVAAAGVAVCCASAVPAAGGAGAMGNSGGGGENPALLSAGEKPGSETAARAAEASRAREGTFIVNLDAAPFPYRGKYGDTRVDFFDHVDPETGARSHTNRYGERLPEKDHYVDRGVLFHVPPHFNPKKPFAFLVFFHGINSDVRKTNAEFNLDGQVDASGRNVILVMPQLARDAADSSPGKLFRKGAFGAFMEEAADTVSARLGGKHRDRCRSAPILLAAFSGGYKAAAYILDRGGAGARIEGVILLDALYEDVDKFGKWIERKGRKSFFVNVFTRGACERNSAELAAHIGRHGLRINREWPARPVSRGELYFVASETPHMEVPLVGPPAEPVADLLRLVAIGKGK
ncbi:MAG TPA: hypothetical protein PK250_19010 [Syntrophobacter fumaroxidans]|nr:hypothetical protein [Syntrophobacter fumaroxidans]